MQDSILKALKWRYATKAFDTTKKVSKDDQKTILEAARLAPSSLGIEAWKFIVVENEEVRKKLREAAYNQPQITDASFIVVTTYRTDVVENIAKEAIERTAKNLHVDEASLASFKQMLDGSIATQNSAGTLNAWVKAQAYIPLGIMLETAALLNIDACPMEGFDPAKFDEILGLKAKDLKSTSVLAVGYRSKDDPAALRPKTRREFGEVVEFV